MRGKHIYIQFERFTILLPVSLGIIQVNLQPMNSVTDLESPADILMHLGLGSPITSDGLARNHSLVVTCTSFLEYSCPTREGELSCLALQTPSNRLSHDSSGDNCRIASSTRQQYDRRRTRLG